MEHALLDHDNGIRILATARNDDVANFSRGSSLVHVYRIEPLPQNGGMRTLLNKAFRFEFKGLCPKYLEGLSRDIVRRCGGLPLEIVGVSGHLVTKETILEWQKAPCGRGGSAMVSDPYIDNFTSILSLSYTGFVQEKLGMTLEVGEEYLIELIRRSVDKFTLKGIPKTSPVHDLVRDVILSKPKELSLCHVFQHSATSIHKQQRSSTPNSSTKSQSRSVMDFNEVKQQKASVNTNVAKIPISIRKLHNLESLDLRNSFVEELPVEISKVIATSFG
ncbi:hypothetical protein SADUNF_Sadunf10G0192100 [Salix dunnii]|uniref:NB-ARC domain-containing protein n=1 Tax=Salix dunnii TaxID=1413687 RepID=A0A835JVI0_9ROSI|nr:hypothetical protein SADUNF_Sadunf10G0192100 [Salix dunnii]